MNALKNPMCEEMFVEFINNHAEKIKFAAYIKSMTDEEKQQVVDAFLKSQKKLKKTIDRKTK